jgi:ribosome maturation factor RimP
MAASSIAEKVTEAVRPSIVSAGLVLEDVQVAPAGARTVVRVIIDLDEDATGALALDQVAKVSRVVSEVLDSLPALRNAYTLEVSSPGTSRPLTQLRHFKRARTRLVAVDMLEGPGFTRRLTAVEGADLVFDDGDLRVPFDEVRRGQVEVELKRAAAIDDSALDECDELGDFEGSDDTDQDDEV